MFLGVFWILSIGQSKYRTGKAAMGAQMGDMEMSPLAPVPLPAACKAGGGPRGGVGYALPPFREYLTSPEGCHF